MRVRTPTLLQMEAVECGAASLGIILSYFGRFAPLEELRAACGVSRDGSKASNIVKAATRYGLIGKGFKKELDTVRAAPLPFIAFWNFNHFVVVEGFGKKWVYLNDPASGPRKVSNAEFDQSFTGAILTFTKTPEFRKGGKKPGLLGALASRLRGNRMSLVFAILATLALVVPNIAVPVFGRVYVDQILVGGLHNWLNPLLIVMSIAAVVAAALTWLQQSALLHMEMNMSLVGSARFFWHILRLPMEFFSQRDAGDIGNRVAINDTLATILSGDLATNTVGLLLIGFYAALLFQYSAPLTSIGLAIAFLNVMALRYVS